MKVILLQDIKGTGKKDQIMEISDGYARNYLLPRKLAKEATAEALNAIERSKSADKHREDVRRQEAEALAHQLKGKVVQLTVRGGENGKLYGSITNDQIAEAVKAQLGVDADKRKIEVEEPIKNAGQAFFTLKLMAGISTRMIVNVKVETKYAIVREERFDGGIHIGSRYTEGALPSGIGAQRTGRYASLARGRFACHRNVAAG